MREWTLEMAIDQLEGWKVITQRTEFIDTFVDHGFVDVVLRELKKNDD